MKDKIITFRHQRIIYFEPDKVSEDDAKNILINKELDRGYVPARIEVRKVRGEWYGTELKPRNYDCVFCVSAYAGKKAARIFYEDNKEMLNNLKGMDTIRIPQ